MRTAVEVAAQLGAPILSAAARASLNSSAANTRPWATCSSSARSLSPAPCSRSSTHPWLRCSFSRFSGSSASRLHCRDIRGVLLIIAGINQRATAQALRRSQYDQSKANMHLDSMSRNSQIINALAMIPEAVKFGAGIPQVADSPGHGAGSQCRLREPFEGGAPADSGGDARLGRFLAIEAT